MSFLSEVLSAAEKSEIQLIKDKIPVLTTEINNLKSEVWHYINSICTKFTEKPQINVSLIKKTTKLSEDLDIIQKTVEEHLRKDIPNAENDISNKLQEIQDINVVLAVVSRFVHLHNSLMIIRNLQKQNKFVDAVKEIQRANSEITHLEAEEEIKKALGKMKIDLLLEETLIRDALNVILGDNIFIETEDRSSTIKNSLRVNCTDDNLKDALIAFYKLDTNFFLLNKISDFINEHICLPVLVNSSTIEVKKDNDSYTLKIYAKTTANDSNYKEVFSKLLQVFQFLHSYFKFPLDDDLSSFLYICKKLKKTFIEYVIKYCLLNTIPSNEEELQTYDQVKNEINKFENNLYEYSVFQSGEAPFTDFVKDINKLYLSNKCQEYTQQAILLMKKDLHEIVEIGSTVVNEPSLDNPLEFPKCCVSKSVIEISNLIYTMLQESTEASEVAAKQIIGAVQNILIMYGSVVLENHEKMLQTIPQQVALFKNNCFYLAFQLDKWNETYKPKLHFLGDTSFLFKDQSHQLRIFSADVFQHHVEGQINQIDEILQNSSLRELQTLENMNNNIEKAVRQCLRQQELLRTVWHKVLSYVDYNETLGHIFNSFCNKLLMYILAVEDISSQVADQLVDVCKIVQTRGPKLFSEPKEIHMFVEVWYRFNQVVFILSASLVEINDKWANGKGPMALVLKAEEVKKLVKALFQNTDHRAAVLAKIS